jgi:RHS repeat-associated protein
MKTPHISNAKRNYIPGGQGHWVGRLVQLNYFCLVWLFLLAGPRCIDAQSCSSPGCNVQYQVSGAYLDKCQFEEYTNEDLPRIHMYHNQTTESVYNFHETYAGSNNISYDGAYNAGAGITSMSTDGAYSYDTLQAQDVTYKEFGFGPYCTYSNSYSGFMNVFVNNTDARSWWGYSSGPGCEWAWSNMGSHSVDTQTDPVWAEVGGVMQWAFNDVVTNQLTYDSNWSSCDGSCSNCVSSNGSTNLVPASMPYYNSLQTLLTPAMIAYVLTGTRNYSNVGPGGDSDTVSESGSTTYTLTNEYTDSELYSNIMGLIPPFSGTWNNGDDFWSSIAYSGISASHCDGNPWTGSQEAELQKMEYRFEIPDSQAFTTYKITWDLVTYDIWYGIISTVHSETNVMGNGSDLYTDGIPVDPPWWDQSPYGGYVFTWVANVGVSIVPTLISSSPGSGPGWGSGSGGSGCSSCSGGGSPGGSAGFTAGAYATFSLGQSISGFSAGSLQVWSAQPTSGMSTPAALSITATTPGVEIILTNNQLRQVNASQALADIVVSNAYSYQICYYLPSQVGSLSNGVHQLSGSPFLTWQVTNPDGATATNRLQFTKIIGAQASVYECDYTASNGSWKFEYPGGAREDEVDTASSTNADGLFTTVTRTTRVPGGPDQLKIQRVYETYCPYPGVVPQGPYLVQETLDPDNNPKTTTYTYNWGSYANGTFIPVDSVTMPDGSWKKYYSYDSLGRPTMVYFSKQDATLASYVYGNTVLYYYDPSTTVNGSGDDGTVSPNTPRETWQNINGLDIFSYTAFPSKYVRLDIRCLTPYAAWNDPANLVTTTTNYATGPNAGRVQSVLNPDGTMQIYVYAQAVDGSQTNTVYSGQPNTGKTAIVDGSKTVTILGPVGQLISRTESDIVSTITTSQEIYGDYDEFSRPQSVTYLDGTTNITAYDCCGVEMTVDRDGVPTYYTYDAARRQVASTHLDITTTNILDAAGNVLKSLRIGSDSSVVTLSQSKYDLAGRLVAETNALQGVTTYSETTNSLGGLVRTTTYPDGGTRIEEYYLDQSLKSVTGTAVPPVRYEYGIDYSIYPYAQYSKEIKLNTDGTDSSEWVQNDTDALGRPCWTIYAAASGAPASYSYYNHLGQLTNEVDPDGVSTLYQYDGKGETAYTAVDMNQNGVIDFGGVDRITWTTNDVTTDHGTNVRRTRTFVWDTLNVNSSSLVSVVETSTDGLKSWQTQYRDAATPVTSQSQTIYGANRTVTTTAPDNSYAISVYTSGRLVSVTRYDSTSAQIGQTTYTYDAHGRQYQVTDARNGATTYGYNSADLLATVTTPNPGNGGAAQTTTTYYNKMLQATNVVQPDGASVFSIYYPGGPLAETYGSRTYPVAYSYDYAGRMKTMTNWSNFSGGTGARVTTWNYDPYQGFLTNKAYADGTGPFYGYTQAGRLVNRTWVRTVSGTPIATSYAYDTAGSLTNVSYNDGTTPAVATAYDRLGRPATITQGSLVTKQTYNFASELLGESYVGGILNGLFVTNRYDTYLRRTNVTALNGGTALSLANYGYDNASQLQTVDDGNGNSATYSYLANSPLVSQITFAQSSTMRMTTTKQFDYLNRLTSISSQPGASGQPSSAFNYNYNSANQRTKNTFPDGSHWVYQYDWLGQVTNGARYWSDGTPVAGQQYQYQFDTIGNRTQARFGGDTNGANLRIANYTANTLNQITQRDVPGTNDIVGAALLGTNMTVNGVAADRKLEYFRGTVGTNNASHPAWLSVIAAGGGNSVTGSLYVAQTPEQFKYDADGNLTNDGRWAFTWDAENRLTKMTVNTNVGPQYQLTFSYDAKGRRIQKLVVSNSVAIYTNRFMYDGWNLVAELKPSNLPVRSYIWGNDLSGSMQGAGGVGGLLEVSYYGSGTTNCFAGYDGNGNLVTLVNVSDGTTVANYEYGPFGEVIRTTGAMAKNNPMRFSTKYQDDESDLLYYGYRYYKPSAGTWLSRDQVNERSFAHFHRKLSKRVNQLQSGDYCCASDDLVDMFDLLGCLKVITLKVAGDTSGILLDTFNLAGLEGQIQTLKDVLHKCKSCDPDIQVIYTYDWTLYKGPDDSQWDMDWAGDLPDVKLAMDNWKKIHAKGGIPLLLTGFSIVYPDNKNIAGATSKGKGMLINAGQRSFYFRTTILAHELGHYAGYDGGDLDNKAHSSNKDNIMYMPWDRGTTPDDVYCQKVLSLAP